MVLDGGAEAREYSEVTNCNEQLFSINQTKSSSRVPQSRITIVIILVNIIVTCTNASIVKNGKC